MRPLLLVSRREWRGEVEVTLSPPTSRRAQLPTSDGRRPALAIVHDRGKLSDTPGEHPFEEDQEIVGKRQLEADGQKSAGGRDHCGDRCVNNEDGYPKAAQGGDEVNRGGDDQFAALGGLVGDEQLAERDCGEDDKRKQRTADVEKNLGASVLG